MPALPLNATPDRLLELAASVVAVAGWHVWMRRAEPGVEDLDRASVIVAYLVCVGLAFPTPHDAGWSFGDVAVHLTLLFLALRFALRPLTQQRSGALERDVRAGDGALSAVCEYYLAAEWAVYALTIPVHATLGYWACLVARLLLIRPAWHAVIVLTHAPFADLVLRPAGAYRETARRFAALAVLRRGAFCLLGVPGCP